MNKATFWWVFNYAIKDESNPAEWGRQIIYEIKGFVSALLQWIWEKIHLGYENVAYEEK